jgi:carbamoyltransferase
MITVGLYGIPDTTHGPAATYTHDHGVVLMRDGRVLAAVELERWTGRKHDNRLPLFIHEILAALVPSDEPVRFVSANSFAGSTFLAADGNLRIEPDGKVDVGRILTPASVRWYPDGITPRPAEGWIICHEMAHLAALLPFVGQFEDGSLLIHIDGGASDSASSVWRSEESGAQLISTSWDRLKVPVNNFNVNPLVRAILGLKDWEHLSIPGKLMGYAGWGTPKPEYAVWLKENGWFLDRPDDPVTLLAQVNSIADEPLTAFDPTARLLQDLCATIQAYFEEEIVRAVDEDLAHVDGGAIYYAGGAALNIPANVRIAQLGRRLYVPPPTNDSGLALGAAAWLEYQERGRLPLHSPFLGRYGGACGAPDMDAIPQVADLFNQGAVVGICNGAGEVGPRALGHRSLLARADDPRLRQRVSETIKGREWYRPLAPVIAVEVAKDVLGPDAAESPLAHYMLGAWPVAETWRKAFAGVLHGDGSVRAQVVWNTDPENAWLHALLLHVWERYRLPGLINTSFNPNGRAIVQRHEDALPLARQMGLDAVVIHGSLYRL